jgi:hypothetical protein
MSKLDYIRWSLKVRAEAVRILRGTEQAIPLSLEILACSRLLFELTGTTPSKPLTFSQALASL